MLRPPPPNTPDPPVPFLDRRPMPSVPPPPAMPGLPAPPAPHTWFDGLTAWAERTQRSIFMLAFWLVFVCVGGMALLWFLSKIGL